MSGLLLSPVAAFGRPRPCGWGGERSVRGCRVWHRRMVRPRPAGGLSSELCNSYAGCLALCQSLARPVVPSQRCKRSILACLSCKRYIYACPVLTLLRHPVHAQLRRACGRGPGFGAAGASGARDALLQLHDLVRKGRERKEGRKRFALRRALKSHPRGARHAPGL